ncbi:MAG: hypothetical protein CL870_03275 [Cytophagia bacterium]|nr:hypothetical protein [Cytophagia bacterium]
MSLVTYFARLLFQFREKSIQKFIKNPIEYQKDILLELINQGGTSEYGKRYEIDNIKTYEQFNKQVPVVNYEDFFPQIEKTLRGNKNIIWPGKFKWFAKSSGTTNDKSKFIPVSNDSLKKNHLKAGRDLLSVYLSNYKKSNLFDGLALALGGSKQLASYKNNKDVFTGDISAILLKNLPLWVKMLRTPSIDVALMPDWEKKLSLMAKITSNQNITSLSGVPTWTIVLIKEVLKITGKKNILEVWPNLELFIHGAVSFVPYENLFKELIPSKKMRYLETYNASEGFIAFQDNPDIKGMMLLTNHGIFYEFEDVYTKGICDLSKVKINKEYALLMTTFSGLWRYRIGDTIKFLSIEPYRILITGRTKHFINAFGEELIVENSDMAISNTCKLLSMSFYNYSAAPIFITGEKRGAHEWIIELENLPDNKKEFSKTLDKELRKVNSDYDAKRFKDIALKEPKTHFVGEGFFDFWLKTKKRLGGQNKVPRLSNNRKHIDDMLKYIKQFQ